MKNMKYVLTGIVALFVVVLVFSCASTGGSGGGEEFVNPGYRWNFDDPEAGTAGWVVVPEEFWAYKGPAELSRDDTTFGRPMLRFDVDFTDYKGVDWSEPKIRYYFEEPFEMRGLSNFSFDFYYNPQFSSSGHFKSKIITLAGTRTRMDDVTGEINPKEEEGDYLKATISFRARRYTGTMDSIVLSIAGYMTDYKGPLFFDNLRLE
ncbi:MAG: hypothetical protein LBU66_07665 [Treponema sp.]|jgi:hypothetical protein|nr:hypothetical protein [Treponema sp.]